ncbi:hypothetical protein AMTR_s00012p00264150 [Amborella trichopoda]|uniref:Uncharacterized protein n=1 Tax=Amborella trichopoda TaxID=13333 RepID=W1PK08_AMBTC|nr:hypothetical protein AMTR_s00012p00264150 [Amborella trichopoda]
MANSQPIYTIAIIFASVFVFFALISILIRILWPRYRGSGGGVGWDHGYNGAGGGHHGHWDHGFHGGFSGGGGISCDTGGGGGRGGGGGGGGAGAC